MSLNFVFSTELFAQQRPLIFPRSNKWLWCVFVFAGLLMSACNDNDTLSDSVRNLTFSTLTGEKINIADNSGPVLINFWATDCAICIHEMPELADIYTQYKESGFQLIAVAMPYDAPNNVLEMAEHEQWPFPVALDISGEALASFATVTGTPTSYLLDDHGKLIKRYVGRIPTDKLRQKLNSLLDLG